MVHIENSHELLIKHEAKDLIKVVIESRFASDSTKGLLINKKFTLACMRDCFLRGEAPYASHVLYAQSHIVDDFVASERALGMHAGFLWGDCATKTVVYTEGEFNIGAVNFGTATKEKVIKLCRDRNIYLRELGGKY